MTARLLFVGDIHLGRRPARLPQDLERLGLVRDDLTPAAAWRAACERAISLDVDAVVLAGDVVDGLDDRFEAYAPLRAGVERLLGSGIAVYAVAGNHDVDALPRLARQIDDFHLLGADGRWEVAPVRGRSGGEVDLLGWSFPEERVRSSPLDHLSHRRRPGIATLGVLHCDVDAGSSPYAPVTSAALRDAPVDAWLLGHVHRPDALGGERPIGYLGSLQGLDPGEPGARGPWLVEVDASARVRARQLPLAPLRYERTGLTLPASAPDASPDDVADTVFGLLAARLREVAARVATEAEAGGGCDGEAGGPGPRLVLCRVAVGGPGRHEPGVRALLVAGERHPVERQDGVHAAIESIEEQARPDLDLEAIAAGDDPPALLARRLLVLAQGGPQADELLARAGGILEPPLAAPRWQRVDDDPLAAGPLTDTLLRAGTQRLEALLAQRPAARRSRSAPASGTPERDA